MPSDRKNILLAHLLLLAASILWGCSYIFIKELILCEPNMTTFVLVMLRLAVATLFAFPLLFFARKLERIARRDVPLFLLIAFGEPFLYSIFETSGISRITGSLASIITATIPLFLPFGMALVYHERIRWSTIAGIVVSFFGLAIMLFDGNMQLVVDPVGLLFLFGSVLVAVLYTLVLVKLVYRYEPVTITVYQNLFALLYFIPLVLMFNRDSLVSLSYSPKMLSLVAFLGLLCSTLAYVFFNRGVRHLGATVSTVYTNLIPVSSLILAMMLGQESFEWVRIIGVAIVIVGLFVAQINSDKVSNN